MVAMSNNYFLIFVKRLLDVKFIVPLNKNAFDNDFNQNKIIY